MKAQKVTLNITVEALHVDCLPGLLSHVIEQIDREMVSGELVAEDGDTVEWKTSFENVTI